MPPECPWEGRILPLVCVAVTSQVVQEYQYSLFVFSCALIMLMVSAVLWSWTLHYAPAAVSLTLVSLGCLYLIYLTSFRILRRFDVPRSQLVTGRFIAKDARQGKLRAKRSNPGRHGYQRLYDEASHHREQGQGRRDQVAAASTIKQDVDAGLGGC